ncbi:hypothetical protein SALBM311S_02506 [Streptomyces alboniger]
MAVGGSSSVAATRENPVIGRPLPANQRCRGSHSRSSGSSDARRPGLPELDVAVRMTASDMASRPFPGMVGVLLLRAPAGRRKPPRPGFDRARMPTRRPCGAGTSRSRGRRGSADTAALRRPGNGRRRTARPGAGRRTRRRSSSVGCANREKLFTHSTRSSPLSSVEGASRRKAMHRRDWRTGASGDGAEPEGGVLLADLDHAAGPVQQRGRRGHRRLDVGDLVAVDRVHDGGEAQLGPGRP